VSALRARQGAAAASRHGVPRQLHRSNQGLQRAQWLQTAELKKASYDLRVAMVSAAVQRAPCPRHCSCADPGERPSARGQWMAPDAPVRA
jgi:hypothetical protein